MFLKASLLIVYFAYVNAFAGQVTEQYPNTATLSADKYTLYWKANSTTIVFEAHVRTQGWVGLGFSNGGTMWPGDAAIGYVSDDGNGHLKDYHTVGYRRPVDDFQQDYTLLAYSQDGTGTMLKFARPLATGDQHDRTLQAGNTFVIWAYGLTDQLQYHGATRGSKQLGLISTDFPVGK